jgi:hypothetical protein
LKGAPPTRRETLQGCGEVAAWSDGLTLFFVEGDFVGWAQDNGRAGTKPGCFAPGGES